MQIATVNVNGIRAAVRKGFYQWLSKARPDVLLMQEVRAPEAIVQELMKGGGESKDAYRTWLSPSAIPGRAGVAVAVRRDIAVSEVRSGLPVGISGADWLPPACSDGIEMRIYDGEEPVDTGRWLEVDLPDVSGGLTVVSAYLHSGVADKLEKMAAKYAHLDRVTLRLEELEASASRPYAHALVAGDFNIVHTERDIKNWKSNHNKTSGVLDQEIAYLDRWLGRSAETSSCAETTSHAGNAEGVETVLSMKPCGAGWVDVQRALAPQEQGPYSWWSNRGQAFDKNVGWRIDYQIANVELASLACDVRIDRASSYAERWSDHAPVVVTYEL